MVYIILITGLIIIFLASRLKPALKPEQKPVNSTNPNFMDMLNENTENYDKDLLLKQVKDLNERMDELENAFLLYFSEANAVENRNEGAAVTAFDQQTMPLYENNIVKPAVNADDTNHINNQIYSLYDSGKSIEEIASFLQTGKGEVSLRLGLRKQKK